APTNGDFIQRHAIALAGKIPLVVIHTIHDEHMDRPVRYEISVTGPLTEILVYFRHTGNTGTLAGKFTYNSAFYRYTQQLVDHLISKYGRPACIHVHVPVKMGRVAMKTSKKWDIPYVVSEQSSKYLPGIEDGYHNRSWFYRVTVKMVFRNALAVSNVSAALGKIIGELAGRNDIKVIRNVADPEVFRYIPVENQKFRFIHASTLKSQKNIEGILRVFEQLYTERKDFELHVLGGEARDIEAINSRYGIAEWLTLEGTVDHSRVAGHMQKANCLVMFSRDENFPCVIVEALCCGLPVISSDAGGCAEAIHPGNGIVVSSGNEAQLLAAVKQLLNNYSWYNRKGIADEAASLYGNERIASDFIEFYRNAKIRI
ncbi:MAG TPA: glycosyltransferase, partial [Chitinophagaceae bacterium]|nr:glycosyltransferase [Chitinophagaceae bacterium]